MKTDDRIASILAAWQGRRDRPQPRQHRFGRVLLPFAIALLLAGCGDEVTSPPPEGEEQARAEISDQDLQTLTVTTNQPDVGGLLQRMFETRTPTGELMADFPGGSNPDTVELVNRLRGTVLWHLNRGWMPPPEDGWWWAEDRCCLPEALVWKRGMRVEVTVLALTETTAEAFGAAGELAPLAESKKEVLKAAARENCALSIYGPVTLRAGETARLAAGWTRARRIAVKEDDRLRAVGGADTFSGCRIAVTARAEAERQPWNLEVFASLERLESDAAVEEKPIRAVQQPLTTHTAMRKPASNTVRVAEAERCWIMSLRPNSALQPSQVLFCARLVDLE